MVTPGSRALAIVLGAGMIASPALAQPPERPTPAASNANKPPPLKGPEPLAASLSGEARTEYLSGKMLYETGDFGNALVKFRRAYELSPEPRLLKNIAVCEKDVHHYSRALELIEEYRAKAGSTITPQEESNLSTLETALRGLSSRVTFLVSEPGATVSVDDQQRGTAPLQAPVRIDVGEHKITVEKPGFKPFSIQKRINGGTSLTLVAVLLRDAHKGRLIVEAGEKDVITIDGKMVGLGRHDSALRSGGHTVRVSAPGMVIYQSEVVVQDGETRRIPVTLSPLPAKSDTSRWLWLGGGLALAAGAAIGGALIFKPTEPSPINGSLGTIPLTFGGL